MIDKKVFDLIEKERVRQTNGLELIASENYASNEVMAAAGSILTNKYAEGLPGKRYYGGCSVVDNIEDLCRERLKKLFNASWVNVQPHSGAQANASVMLALLKAGDKILGFNLSHGGHLTHGSSVNFSGKYYKPYFYGVNKKDGLIDYNNLEETAKKEKPKLIICGASSYSREWNYKQIREVADKCGAFVLADIAHPAGLISRGLLNDPLEYCHVVTSTTHKTLRGPRGGIIMMRQDYDNFEIIAIDDSSDDKTGKIIEKFSKKDFRVIHVKAREKPGKWMGKNWACMEGFKKATGDIMLFTDADTKFE